ncbi:BRCT domain [Macleaya cordata]|uniref:BRCT domain n=1 Tax=Macleaya cordata TaxID=56857 RepID=A0A200QQ00_MACCD|nr:BRCT domain [Macleaya cordata]
MQSDSDTLTQSPSQSFSGDVPENGNADDFYLLHDTMRFDDTVPLEVESQMLNLDCETQELEDADCDGNFTQLLDELETKGFGDSDGEGTDRTVVLDDDDDESEIGIGDNPVSLGERQYDSHCEPSVKDFVVDSDASSKKFSSGSVRRSFMSVRTASLRASSNAAVRVVTPNKANKESSFCWSNIQSVTEHLRKDDEMADIRNPTSVCTRLTSGNTNDGTCNWSQNMKGLGDKRVSSVVRKLLYEDTSTGNNAPVNDSDGTNGGKDMPDLLAFNHELARLSYVDSHEPGESSQINALDIVDKFLLVNDVKLSQEVVPEKTIKEKTPLMSREKGTQTLAKRSSLRSPIRDVSIFDWSDIRDGEEAGKFFCKRKEEGLNLGKNIMGLTRSDSRLVSLDSEGENKVVEISELKTKNNLEFDELLNAEALEQLPEATGTSNDLIDMYDVGFDTQMAAEAMEALVCGPPASHDMDECYHFAETVVVCSPRSVTKKKARLKHEPLRKRPSSTDSDGMTKQTKRTKIAKTKPSNEVLITSCRNSRNSRIKQLESASAVKTKAKKDKLKGESAYLGTRYTKSFELRKTVGEAERSSIKGVDRSDSSLKSNENLSPSKRPLLEYSTFTPIACRTRLSRAAKPLKGLNSSNNSGEGRNILREFTQLSGKSSSLGVDAPLHSTVTGKSSMLGSKQISILKKNKQRQQRQQEPSELRGLHEEIAIRSYEIRDALSYHPRGKRTRRNMSVRLNRVGDLDGQSKVTAEEVNIESITRRKRSKRNVTGSCVNRKTKKETQPFIHPLPSSSFPGKKYEGSLAGSNVYESGPANGALNCSSAVMNEKMVPEVLCQAKSSAHCGKKGDVDFVSPPKDAEGGITPINCNTLDMASRSCKVDYNHKKSCKKSLSRSSHATELIRLDAIEAASNPALKDLRKRRDMANVRVLFSNHLDEDIIKQQQKISARLGVSIASSSSEATHFVTDQFARTRNMLEAIALGKPVVTHLWLESCGQASCFIDEKNYIMRDPKKEKEIGFSMPVSLARARECPLLQGKEIFITPNVKPSRELVLSLAKAVHGQIVESIGRSAKNGNKIPEDLLILSCEDDYTICAPLIEKGAAVYSSELLLSGIVIQKLEYDRHRLFTDHNHIKRIRPTHFYAHPEFISPPRIPTAMEGFKFRIETSIDGQPLPSTSTFGN